LKKALTDTLIRSLRAPSNGRLEINDASCRGLSLRVTQNDVRTWSFRFTNVQGSVSRLAIGNYPAVPLAEARLRADALRRDIANGVDPVLALRQRKIEARSKSKTFGHLAERYIVEHTRRHNRPRTAEENERNLRKHVLPHWADRPYAQITRADIVELIERIADKHPIAANRVATLISRLFTFAIDIGVMTSSPAVRLKKPGKERVKTRVLTDDELRLFWPRIVETPVSRPAGLALRAALLLGLRAGEIAGLRRDELQDFDDKKRAAIELRGGRTKNGRPLRLPLSTIAHQTIAEAADLSADDVFVFPGIEGAPIEAHSLATAMRRFRESLKGDQAKSWRSDPPTPHDLRRTLRCDHEPRATGHRP
jgi:integrase